MFSYLPVYIRKPASISNLRNRIGDKYSKITQNIFTNIQDVFEQWLYNCIETIFTNVQDVLNSSYTTAIET